MSLVDQTELLEALCRASMALCDELFDKHDEGSHLYALLKALNTQAHVCTDILLTLSTVKDKAEVEGVVEAATRGDAEAGPSFTERLDGMYAAIDQQSKSVLESAVAAAYRGAE